MSLLRRFSVVVVAFVLAGTSPTLAQDIPDDATRARVADWLDRCSRRASDACMPVLKRLEGSAMFGWCQAIEWQWDAARLVRDPENARHSFEESQGRREKAHAFIEKCVPIYAAALDETDGRTDSSREAGGSRQVTPADRVMQAVTRSNVRSGPGLAHDRVGLLDIDDQVRVTGVVGDWLRIAAPDGGEAFIYGPLLAEVTPDQGTTAVGQEQEPASSTVAVTEAVGARDPVASSAGSGPQVTPADRVMQAVTRSNVRSGPGLAHDRVGLLDIDDQVRVTGVVGDWLRIAAPDGGEAFIYGPLLAEVTPDQGRTAVERETEPASSTVGVTEPACTPEPPEGSGCWQELTERPGCHIWLPARAYGLVHTTWSGGCAGGKAEGEGLLGRTMGEHFHTERPATFDAGFVTEMGQFVVVDGPSEQTRPVSEEPGTDTPSVDVTSGSGPLHGSIAFSQEADGAYAWGIAWSFDSAAGARAEALGQCREYGGMRCAEAGWFQEACGALAIGGGNGYGTGWGATTAEAERDALAQCRAVNDDCRIEVARCSRSEEAGGAGRMDGAMPDQEDSVATISTEPKCEPELFSDVWERSPCWHELENPDGCYVYWAHMPSREIGELARILWSGSCSRGVATGEGTLEIYRKIYAASTEPAHYSATGTLDNNGLRQGRWVETDYHSFTSIAEAEGHYVDGKRDGRWTLAHEGALRTAESYYVEGEQTSVWTDGVVELGAGWWRGHVFPDSLQHD